MLWHDSLTQSDFIDLIILARDERIGAADLIVIFDKGIDCQNPPKDVVQ